jgi:uncharacterized membrane protein
MSNSLDLVLPLSLLVTGMGIFVFVSGLTVSFTVRNSLPLALEFWTAAGLLRLSHHSAWSAIAVAGTIVLLRKIVGFSLSHRLDVHR